MTDAPARKRAKGISPTRRSLAYLRGEGYRVEVVERWVPYPKKGDGPDAGPPGVRKDLFGFIDLIAVCPCRGILAVQATSGANVSHRRNKILLETLQAAQDWLAAGGQLEIHGWRKSAKTGRWTLRRVLLDGTELEA